MDEHYRALERMYLAAPINSIFNPRIRVEKEKAEIEIEVKSKFFHSARAVHGSVYFKLLDDAAFFAANSIEKEFFVLTASSSTTLTRAIDKGWMRSTGKVTARHENKILAEAIVYNDLGEEIGRGNGIFVRGKLPLVEAMGYNAGI